MKQKNLTSHKNSLIYISIAFLLTILLMIVQFIASYMSKSLALFADGTHMLVHNSSLLIALISSLVSFYASKKSSLRADLIDISGGIINGLIFIAIAIFILVTGIERIHEHEHSQIDPTIMSVIAVFGFFIHCTSAFILNKGKKHSFNVHAIFLHTFFDCISTVLIFITGLLIILTDIHQLDSIVSLIIALLIMFSGTRLLKKCIKKLLFLHKATSLRKSITNTLLKNLKHIENIHNDELRFENNQQIYCAHIVLKNSCINSQHNNSCLKETSNILKNNFNIEKCIIQVEYL